MALLLHNKAKITTTTSSPIKMNKYFILQFQTGYVSYPNPGPKDTILDRNACKTVMIKSLEHQET